MCSSNLARTRSLQVCRRCDVVVVVVCGVVLGVAACFSVLGSVKSMQPPIDDAWVAPIGLSNTLRGAMASWSKSLSRELAPCITINNILPGFTDTDRLGSLASSISDRTGNSVDDITEGWLGGVPIQRLVDPLETAIAVTFLCLPSSGAIRGVSLAVDGGRMRSI